MIYLDLTSLSFNSKLKKGTGTSSWSTALGQSASHKFTYPGYENILVGIAFNSIPKYNIKCKRGKGGHYVDLESEDEIQQVALFEKVYINDVFVGSPFFLLQTKQMGSIHHEGRRAICYSPSIAYYDDSYSNAMFYRMAAALLGVKEQGCWFIYAIDIKEQDELHLYAVVVDENEPVYYEDSSDRKYEWASLIP